MVKPSDGPGHPASGGPEASPSSLRLRRSPRQVLRTPGTNGGASSARLRVLAMILLTIGIVALAIFGAWVAWESIVEHFFPGSSSGGGNL